MSEEENKRNLAAARGPASETKQMAKTAKAMTKAITPLGAFALLKYIDLSKDLAYIPAFFAAATPVSESSIAMQFSFLQPSLL